MDYSADNIEKNGNRMIPAPVRLALTVLAGLEQNRAEKLRKTLPAYAMTLEKQGCTVTEETLREALARGDAVVMGPRPAFTRAAQTIEQRYERIAGKRVKPEDPWVQDDPGMPADKRFLRAAQRGDLALMKALNEKSGGVLVRNSEVLSTVARCGHLEIVKYLAARGADIRECKDQALRWAAAYERLEVAKYLTENGADLLNLEPFQQVKIKPIFKNMDVWIEKTGAYPPDGLEHMAPGSFDPAAVKALGPLIEREDYMEIPANRYACNALNLFGTAEKVMDYFEKWAKPGKQPLHDVIQMIIVPDKAPDLKSWLSAVMEHGPEMAKLVRFADKLPQPVRSGGGKGWSLVKTRAETAKFAYPKAGENHELAVLFNRHSKDEESFDAALEIVKTYKGKTKGRIPDITIDGARFGLPKAVFRKLPDGDYRGLVLGDITDCCQSIGGVGAKCAEHGFMSENGGFYVVAINDNKKGDEEIIGQSWAWRGTKDELVLDSLETLGGRIKPEQWTMLAREFAKALKKTDVAALHIGTGGDTPDKMPFIKVKDPAQPVDYSEYRDSDVQLRVWNRKYSHI